MAFCINCGNKLDDNNRFCEQCGADVRAMRKAFNEATTEVEETENNETDSMAELQKSEVETNSLDDNRMNSLGVNKINTSDANRSNINRPKSNSKSNSNSYKSSNVSNNPGKNSKETNSTTSKSAISSKVNTMDSAKRSRMIMISAVAAIILVAGIGVILSWWNIMNYFGKYDEDHPGKIYCHITDEEHTAMVVPGVCYADNEILVVSELGVSESKIKKLAKKYNAKIVGEIQQTGDYQWQFDEVYTEDELENLANTINTEDIVSRVDINYITETSIASVEDVNPGSQWTENHKTNEETKNKYISVLTDKAWGIKAIQADMAWGFCNTIKDEIKPVRVGLIDTSFDVAHEDLNGCFDDYYDFGLGNNYNSKDVDGKHGTHVAGTFAANGNNDIGICGVYPYAQEKIFAVIGLGENSRGNSVIQNKCQFAELILRNVKVINRSMGGADVSYYLEDFDFYSRYHSKLGISDEEAKLKDKNIIESNKNNIKRNADILCDFFKVLEKKYDFIIVNSAGNESKKNKDKTLYYSTKTGKFYNEKTDETDFIKTFRWKRTAWFDTRYNDSICYIGSDGNNTGIKDRIIIVGSIGKSYKKSDFSCIGKNVDIYAPGENIFSTVTGNKYEGGWEGTSQAAPHVAGTAALLYSIDNNLTGPEVKDIIVNRCADMHDGYTGKNNYQFERYGVLDTYNSVKYAYEHKAEHNAKQFGSETNGAIFGWVIDKKTDKPISGAKVTVEGSESSTVNTDEVGHFEIYVAEGDYKLTVVKEGYNDYLFKDNVEEMIKVEPKEIHYIDWIYMESGTTQVTSLKDIDAQAPLVVDTTDTTTEEPTDDTVTEIPIDNIDDYIDNIILRDVLPFLPGYDDHSGLNDSLNASEAYDVMEEAFGFNAIAFESKTESVIVDGYEHDCYKYELEVINKCMSYYTTRVFNESDFPTEVPSREGKAFYRNGNIYFTAWYAGPPSVKLMKAELHNDCIKVYYYWGGEGEYEDYWCATFNKKSDGGYILSETKYLGNGGGDDVADTDDTVPDDSDTEETVTDKDWKRAYLEFLNGFETIEFDNGDRRIQNTNYVVVSEDGDDDYVSAIFGENHPNRMTYHIDMNGDGIPEMLFRDDWSTYVVSYYNGKVTASRIDSKYYYEFLGDSVFFETGGTGGHMDVMANLKDGYLNAYCTGIVETTDGETKYYFLKQDLGDYYKNRIYDTVHSESNRVSEEEYNKLWNEAKKDKNSRGTDSKFTLETLIGVIKDYGEY